MKSLCETCKDITCCAFALECEECLDYERQTNADRIRAMTDEELAKRISNIEQFALTTDGAWSPEQWLEWLKQEVEE